MLLPKFVPAQTYLKTAETDSGFILIRHPLRNYVEYVKDLRADLLTLLRDLDWVLHYKSISRGSLVHRIDLSNLELTELELYVWPVGSKFTTHERKPIARRLTILADGQSLELPSYESHWVDELPVKEKKVVVKEKERALLNSLDLTNQSMLGFHVYAVTHIEDPTFIYFGTISESSNTSDRAAFYQLQSYWKDAQRVGYENQGIKKVFQGKSKEWLEAADIFDLGRIAVPHKDDRYPVLGRLIETAVSVGYIPTNQKTERHEKTKVRSIAMDGPLVDILLSGDLLRYLIKIF